MKRLKDMYARNVSQAALDKAPEAQGVRQLLAVRRGCCMGMWLGAAWGCGLHTDLSTSAGEGRQKCLTAGAASPDQRA